MRMLDLAFKMQSRPIWTLILSLLRILSLRWEELPELSSTCLEDSKVSPCTKAVFIDGGTRQWWLLPVQLRVPSLPSPTRICPQGPVAFFISSVCVGDLEYHTGTKLTTAAGEAVQLRYRLPKKRSLALSSLRWFNLALGSRRIRALRCITRGPGPPRGLGYPGDSPKTVRPALSHRLAALEVDFDAGNNVVFLFIGKVFTISTQQRY